MKYCGQVCCNWGSFAVANVLARLTLLGLNTDLKYFTAAILLAIRPLPKFYRNKLNRNYKFITITVTLTNTKEIKKEI